MAERKTMYAVDASGLIHRAFHAIRGLSNSRGLPTNALYGFATMLRRFRRESEPDYCVVVFDAGRITFRNEIYPEYKANRPPADPALVAQFPYARRLAEAMGFPILEIEGFEADDIIATVAAMSKRAGFDVVIESSDKDLLQLVGDGVTVHDPMKEVTYDGEAVKGKMGVPPELVVDVLSLMGDSSDNIPGVAGIGPKGAAELVSRYGGLDRIYENLGELTPGKRKALERDRDAALLARRLVTLKKDVPIGAGCEDFRALDGSGEELVALLTELEFKSMIDEAVSDGRVTVESTGVRVIEVGGFAELEQALGADGWRDGATMVTVFGTRNPVHPDCRGIAIAMDPENAMVVRPQGLDGEMAAGLARGTGSVEANIPAYKEAHQLFASVGADLRPPAMDPVLGGYLLHPEKESPTLETLALEILKEALPPSDAFDSEAMGKKACAAHRLGGEIGERLEGIGLAGLMSDVEVPVARVLSEMETAGVKADRDSLRGLSVKFGRELQRLEGEIIREAGFPFNPNSPKQLADVLFGKMGLDVIKKTKTGRSTNVAVLEELMVRHPGVKMPSLILEFRSLAKLKSTYADALATLVSDETGRIHTSYNQTVTATGRLSSSDPNLQNIPIRTAEGLLIRSAFVAQEGWEFVSADYSQIELRVLAHLSGDAGLKEAFAEGVDIHSRTAARIYRCPEDQVTSDMRRTAKVINFGLLYGMGAFRLSNELRISRPEAQSFIDGYFAAFPAVRGYLDQTIENARSQGWVSTLTGRRRHIDDISSSNHNKRTAAERMATNTPIQGTAADVIKSAMVRLRDRLLDSGLDARICLQVHDELVVEARKGQGDDVERVLVDVMENAYSLDVPLKVEIGRGTVWSDLH